jgi:hypothetical protein
VSGTWGSSPEQFGLEKGDTIAYDSWPDAFEILPDGRILISDLPNERTAVYGVDGSFIEVVNWKKIKRPEGGISYTMEKYDYIGSVIGYNNNTFWTEDEEGVYRKYDSNFNLLQTSPTRPLELGRWSWRCLEGVKTEEKCFKHHIEIEYPDAVYVYEVTKPLFKSNLKDQVRINDNLIMDNKGEHVYAYSVTGTYMPEGSTRPIKWLGFKAEWVKPEDKGEPPDIDMSKLPPGVEPPRGKIIAQYGTAVLGPDGSIYTWCRSETHYKILRWRWVP